MELVEIKSKERVAAKINWVHQTMHLTTKRLNLIDGDYDTIAL